MRNEALVKAMEALAEAARNAGMAARVISLPESEPAKAEQPDLFEHMDDDGDSLVVVPYEDRDGWLVVDSTGDRVTHLSPDAVNRLAQYLDRYRTDQQDCDVELAEQCGRTPVRPREHWCGRNSDHPGHEYTREEGTRTPRCLGVSSGVYGS